MLTDLKPESVATEVVRPLSPADEARAAKLLQRRIAWHWNLRLVAWSLGIGSLVLVLGVASYLYHSITAATSFRTLAERAAAEGDFDDQVKWLERYSMLRPNDDEAILNIALAADAAADNAKFGGRLEAISDACEQLGDSIARLDEDDAETITDLRKRLIRRLVQLGGFFMIEAERQCIAVNAPVDDPGITRSLAMSLMGQVNTDVYNPRDADAISKSEDYWKWLANQPPGNVLLLAMDRNPEDLELVAIFLDAYRDRPELLGKPLGTMGPDLAVVDLKTRVDNIIASLGSNSTSRAKWLLYDFYARRKEASSTDPTEAAAAQADQTLAKQLVVDHAPTAFASLEKVAAAAKAESADDDEKEAEQIDVLLRDELPESYWDYVLLMEAARRSAETDPENATRWYEQLMQLELSAIPIELVESVFAQAGTLQAGIGQSDRAIEIWRKGLARVPNSMTLHDSLATHFVQSREDDVQAKQELVSLANAIDFAERQLTRLSDVQLPREKRAVAMRGIETSKWRIEVMEAMLSYRAGSPQDAIAKLNRALASPIKIEDENRLMVANWLADIHGANGSWDLAATALDQTLRFIPENVDLRARAADAWQKAGNRLQSIEQWRMAGNSSTGDFRLASTEAIFNYQLRLAPEQRDWPTVRAAIDRIRREPRGADGSTEAIDEPTRARLDVLEVSIPPAGTQAEEHLRSPAFAEQIRILSERYPRELTVQVFAAERLAAVGRNEDSAKAIARLEELLGEDKTPLVITNARITAAQGRPLDASRMLEEQAVKDTVRQAELLKFAAGFAMMAQDLELAIRQLQRIPDKDQTVDVSFLIARLAPNLPPQSPLLTVEGRKLNASEFANLWRDKVREIEGESGTLWRYLEATSLLDGLQAKAKRIDPASEELARAKELSRAISAERPRWGEAISLEGWVQAIEATTKAPDDPGVERLKEQAVDQLRRGIAAGDRQLRTRLLLIGLLRALHRETEAQQELNLASYSTDADIDPYSVIQIDLASRQGDYERSLQIAQSRATDNSGDPKRYEILCQTATLAAKNTDDASRRSELFAEADAAIAKAMTLSDADDVSLFAAELELRLATGDREKINELVARIESSELDAYDIAMLKFRAFEQTGRLEEALAMLQQAGAVRESLQNLVSQAAVFRRLSRSDEELQALRKALKISPDDEDLRFELARAIMVYGGENTDWNEIAGLLAGSANGSPKNRLQYAVMVLQRGNPTQHQQAIQILRDLGREENLYSEDARRLLSLFLKRQLQSLGDSEKDLKTTLIGELRTVYSGLQRIDPPKVLDRYNYGNFLLDFGNDQDLVTVDQLAFNLASNKDGAVFGLELLVRLAQKTKTKAEWPAVVENWLARAREQELVSERDAATAAGVALLKLGFTDLGLAKFADSYAKDPETLTAYIVSLVDSKKFDKAIEICAEHNRVHGDAKSATLLTEVLLKRGDRDLNAEHGKIIEKALQDFPDEVALLESLATLQLQQGKPQQAVDVYKRILAIDPVRIRTLNNLAMAFTEIPGRSLEGIEPIERAIKASGQLPELLDTKGVVLLAAGKYDEAQAVFQQAFDASKEPRFHFHLIVTLLAQNRLDEARQAWSALELAKLDPAGLTAAEQIQLEKLKKDFGT